MECSEKKIYDLDFEGQSSRSRDLFKFFVQIAATVL